MVDMVYFAICFSLYSFLLIWGGWMIGFKDAKKEAKEKYGRKS